MSDKSQASRDVYTEVTDRIIAALDAGTVPWRKPWNAPAEFHRNPVSKTEYRGINPFLLEMTASELCAELGAAMLCGVAGISPPTVDQSAAYIASWLKALNDDRKLLISAAGKAQRAADFIRGTVAS